MEEKDKKKPNIKSLSIKKDKDSVDIKPYYYSVKKETVDMYTGEIKREYKINSPLLAQYIHKNNHIVKNGESLYLYRDGYYKEISKIELDTFIDSFIEVSLRSIRITTETKKHLFTDKHCKSSEELAKPYTEINCKSGIINLNNPDKVFPHKPTIFFTSQIPLYYNIRAQCSKFTKFLNDVLPVDQQNLLQEWIGYLLLPINCIKKFIILTGRKDSGKSVIFKIIEKLIDEKNISNISLQNLCNPHNLFQPYYLKDKILNITPDLPEIILTDPGLIKSITGNDIINAQKKGSHEKYDFKPIARLMFSCNSIPLLKSKDPAYYERMIIIDFPNVIPKDKQINFIENSFNYNGIFNWAVEGLKRLIKNKYRLSISIDNKKQLKKYKIENSHVLQFIKMECYIRPNLETSSKELYDSFNCFCLENGFRPLSRQSMYKEIKDEYTKLVFSENCKDKNGNRCRGIKGIALKKNIKDKKWTEV